MGEGERELNVITKPVLLIRLDGPNSDDDDAKLDQLAESLPGYKYYNIGDQRIYPVLGSGGLILRSSLRVAYLCDESSWPHIDLDNVDLNSPDYIL